MLYEFQNEHGETIALDYPMCDAPSIGSKITVDGCIYTRIPSNAIISAAVKRITHQYPFVSRSLPRGLCPRSQDHEGRPIVRDRAHEREIMAMTGTVKD